LKKTDGRKELVALNPWQAVILGLTQGLTEFLPVSSSAHLVFVPELLGIPKPPLLFDVLLHLATGLAVVLYFRRDLTGLIIDGYKGQGEARKLLFWLVLASLPAVILALAFSDLVKAAFGSPINPAFLLLVTAAMLFSADYAKGQKEMAGLGAVGAFLVGIFQGFALLPGVSRSGSTITAACWWGLSRQAAARFSFLMSIPIIIGAGIYEAKPLFIGEAPAGFDGAYLWGMIAAFISGYFVIHYFLRYLGKGRLSAFGVYCILAGLFMLFRVLI